MRRFRWIEWNLDKIAAHALSQGEVEAAFNRITYQIRRRDGSVEMLAKTPSGREIQIVWRYDRESDQIPDIHGDVEEPEIVVITAY